MPLDKRLPAIYRAASKLFVTRGYRQTQVSDIARESSISTGAVYSLFASKRAIFEYVIKCIFIEGYSEEEITLPVSEEDEGELAKEIANLMGDLISRIFISAQGEPQKMSSFREFLPAIYGIFERYGLAFLIFEHNAASWPELCGQYYKFRLQFIEKFTNTFNLYIQKGELRAVEHPNYHARFIIETFSWWGMHAKHDFCDISVSDEAAKAVTMDALFHAYLKETL